MLDQTKKKLRLKVAKANFKEALMELDPVRVIRRKPLHAVGAVALAGLMMGLTGKKLPRAFFPAAGLISGILKKVL